MLLLFSMVVIRVIILSSVFSRGPNWGYFNRVICPGFSRWGKSDVRFLVKQNQSKFILYQENHPTNWRCTLVAKKGQKITHIHNDTFKGLILLSNLILSDNKISYINVDLFKDLKELISLQLDGNKISILQDGTFQNLVKLRRLQLNHNCLNQINQGTFYGLESLEKLELSSNRICHFNNGTFKYFKKLQELLLNSNCLKEIHKGDFLGLKSLNILGLKNNSLTQLYKESFWGLISLGELELSNNKIEILEYEAFKNLTSLKSLSLRNNCLKQLHPEAFKYLAALKILHLQENTLQQLYPESFFGLSSLKEIYLQNNIGINTTLQLNLEAFKYLNVIDKLNLSGNKVKIHKDVFKGIKSVTDLYLEKSVLDFRSDDKQLQSLRETYVENLYLRQNNLTYISKMMFKGLRKIVTLHLNKNHIVTIVSEAFIDLESLKRLLLGDNRLIVFCKGWLTGLESLEFLDLANNLMHHIGPNTFSGIPKGTTAIDINIPFSAIHSIEQGAFSQLSPNSKHLNLDLRRNKIAALSWLMYIQTPFDISDFYSHKVVLHLSASFFECTRSLCWMQTLQWKQLRFDNYNYNVYDYEDYLEDRCDAELSKICPDEDKWCMNHNKTQCKIACKETKHKTGNLLIDGDVCPFQYFCNCTCLSQTCAEQCMLEGKNYVKETIDFFGCPICDCECKTIDCIKTCKDSEYYQVVGKFGCKECKCACAAIDCDEQCNGTEYSVHNNNTDDCLMCECKSQKTKENMQEKDMLKIVIIAGALLLGLLLFITCAAYSFQRNKHKKTDLKSKDTLFNTLTQNMGQEVAQQVKESWFDPSTLFVRQLLGNGNFGAVWSAVFEKSSGVKLSVALKVAKGQVKLNNKVVEGLLNEALAMQKFNHPNVLKMLGISFHDNKPCIILPLMINGNLKNYLVRNKLNLKSQHLWSFTLGVAKGMSHVAEQGFIHCDLAARNCMLDANLVVKISDFGLIRNYNKIDYSKKTDSRKPMPVRWMSPEAIQSRTFTVSNDMWAYGVLLWEIFSYGNFPYKNIENMDILKYLMDGNRLRRPETCPDNMYGIMVKCWNNDPEERPNFNQILKMIHTLADIETDYIDFAADTGY